MRSSRHHLQKSSTSSSSRPSHHQNRSHRPKNTMSELQILQSQPNGYYQKSPFVKGMALDFGRSVWVADDVEGYVLGKIADIGADGLQVERDDNGETVKGTYETVYPAEDDSRKTVDDNCALMYLNEGTLLNNCRVRYGQQKIYSYVANILISVNPYEQITNLYSPEAIKEYRGKSLGTMPPHIYAIADKAYRDMRRMKESQSIIVSGESGAGKTESQKAVLRFLCDNWGSSAGPIQQKLLATNPILEAFGNAKTLRNNNSSRFGKFVEIHFGPDGLVVGGFVSHYLLEKSRLCRQAQGERSYHCFYQLIAGVDDATFKRYQLASPDKFNYLKHGCTSFFGGAQQIPSGRVAGSSPLLRDPNVDDIADFQAVQKALQGAGLSPKEIDDIWKTVAAVLHIGNISFVDGTDSKGGCTIDAASVHSLAAAAELLGLDEAELRVGLVSRIMQATKGGVMGTLIRVPLKPHEANAARDALSKAIYSRLFDWLVSAINRSINESANGPDSRFYIGVLDIAGFEFFAQNSFEQFCINYCNEKLQNFFNERILHQEQDLYAAEGLQVPRIEFADNNDCIELFERKGTGLFDLLDEEARLPRAAPQHFTTAAQTANAGHFRLETPRKSRLRAHREMRDDEGLLIRHYAGTVCYQTQQFLDKNNDQLHNSLEVLIQQSSSDFIQKLFESSEAAPATPGKRTKLQAASVGSKFRAQLVVLIEKLRKTGTHFVRCVKPNSTMAPRQLDAPAVLAQLRCAGMASVLRLMQKGYPSRTSFAELYDMYKSTLPEELARLDPRLFCKCLFRALGLDNEDFQFGQTKVFFRAGKFAEFDQMLRQDPANMQMLVSRVKSWLHKTRWRKAQYGAWSVIKLKNKIIYRREQIRTIQGAVRGHLLRQRIKPRLAVYRSTVKLLERSKEMVEVVQTLNEESASKWTEPVCKTNEELEQLLTDIKGSTDLATAVERYESCVKRVDDVLRQLRQQVQEDEKARLAEIEKKRIEEEERIAREKAEEERAEKERAQRRLMEEQREKAERQWEREKARLAEEAEKQKKEEEKRKAVEEQLRLDEALAQRLAHEDKGQTLVDATPSTSVSSDTSTNPKSKYDVSSWKYAQLRDVINTSQDIELLLACREEFHRRLRIYNQWKERNASARDVPPQRAPLALYNSVAPRAVPQVNPALSSQRYFKVPFNKPSDVFRNPNGYLQTNGQNGLWYAHFNGQWIQRQMELHPGKKPLLMTAGSDSLRMCPEKLDQLDLTRRKGAEITENEFETMWEYCGGPKLTRWTP